MLRLKNLMIYIFLLLLCISAFTGAIYGILVLQRQHSGELKRSYEEYERLNDQYVNLQNRAVASLAERRERISYLEAEIFRLERENEALRRQISDE